MVLYGACLFWSLLTVRTVCSDLVQHTALGTAAVTTSSTMHTALAHEFKALEPVKHHRVKEGPLIGKTVNDALRILAPLRDSGGVEHAVAAFSGLSTNQAYTILDTIASREGFSKAKKGKLWEEKRQDFLALIFGVITGYVLEKKPYAPLLELLAHYPGLTAGRPLLYVAATTPYAQTIIPLLYTWLQTTHRPVALKEAGLCALQHNNEQALRRLLTYLTQALQPYLADFLWYIVVHKQVEASLAVMILDAGVPVDTTYFAQYTPLIKAVEVENVPLTRILIERGANIDKVVDDAIGSAWQKAGEVNNDKIISYMSSVRAAKFD